MEWGWRVKQLQRQINSSLFERLALSTDKEGILALANEGHQIHQPMDILKDPYVLEFTGLPVQKRYKENDLEMALKANMEKFLLELRISSRCWSTLSLSVLAPRLPPMMRIVGR